MGRGGERGQGREGQGRGGEERGGERKGQGPPPTNWPWGLHIGKSGPGKDHRMRLSFFCEQLVHSSEQLVLVDTKKGF